MSIFRAFFEKEEIRHRGKKAQRHRGGRQQAIGKE